MSRSGGLISWTAGIGALACTGPSLPPSVAVRDSAGIELVTIGLAPDQIPLWRLSERPDFVIPADPADTTRSPAIGVVGPARWLSGSRVLLADLSGNRLLLYDTLGTFVNTFGRTGRGPGEFSSISTLSVSVFDSVYVDERGRTSILHPTTGFVRIVPRPEASLEAWAHQVWGFGANRLVTLRLAIGPPPVPTGAAVLPWRMVAHLALRDGQGSTMAETPEFDGQYTARDATGDIVAPFSNVPFVAVGRTEAAFGSGQTYLVTVLDSTFRVIREIQWPSQRHVLSQALVDSATKEVRALLAPRLSEVEINSRIAMMFARTVLPAERPAIGGAFFDDEHRLFVAEFVPVLPRLEPLASARWFVHDPTGRPIGWLSLPAGARLEDVRHRRALIVASDSLGNQTIASYQLTQ